MKSFFKIIEEVAEYNAEHGKAYVYVPATFAADMVAYNMRSASVGEVLDKSLDIDENRELEDLIARTVSSDEGPDYYANCMRIGALICAAMQQQADSVIRTTILQSRTKEGQP